jgi:putative transposase
MHNNTAVYNHLEAKPLSDDIIVYMRKTIFVGNEFYHIYNRGVDKRIIFNDKHDLRRFFQSVIEFNTVKPIGSIYQNSFNKNSGSHISKPLVQIIAYCFNPNHFHFILAQLEDRGIEKFMHKLGTGYTRYFNDKYDRSGSLFQGTFKANHISSNEYLLHAGVYVNLNYKIHKLKMGRDLYHSSWDEYLHPENTGICKKDIMLGQFKNTENYVHYANRALGSIIKKRDLLSELEDEKVKQNNNLEAKPLSN